MIIRLNVNEDGIDVKYRNKLNYMRDDHSLEHQEKCKHVDDFMRKLCRKFREQIFFSIIFHLGLREYIMDLFDNII